MSEQATETLKPQTPKLPKGRSPSYPGISLPKAIERAKKVYEHAQEHPLPLKAVTSLWGYKSHLTGPASVTYAALKKYGLLSDEGKGDERMARVTGLALEIFHPNPNQAEAVKRAALNPPIHAEWWSRYGMDVPPTETLRWEMVVKGPWTETGLRDFLNVYTETMRFAKPDSTAMVNGETLDEQGGDGDNQQGTHGEDKDGGAPTAPRRDRVRRPVPGMKTYAIPVDADHDAVIELPTPMTQARWDNFKTFLTAMERIIVDRDEPLTGNQTP